MALSFLQGTQGGLVSSVMSQSVAYGTNTTGGSYLLLSIQVNQSFVNSPVSSVTDTLGNTWVKVVANDNLVGEQFEIWHVPANKVGGGANTVTVHITGLATGIGLVLAEYANQAATPVDVNTALTQVSSPTATYGPVTTNVAGDGLIWIGWTGGGTTWAASGGDAMRINGSNAIGAVLFDKLTGQATPGSYSLAATAASNNLYGALLAIKATFAISGSAGVAGATVSYSGASSGSVVADGSGNYTIPGLLNGSYTITPSLTGYSFSPTNSSQTISGADITGVNFTATQLQVATSTFSPVAGTYTSTQSVTLLNSNSGLTGFAQYYTTDGSTPTTGSTLYTTPISVSTSQTIKVLAVATGYANSNIASAAYVINSTPVPTGLIIQGNAGVPGALITYTGPTSGTVTADANGLYTINNVASGTYTVTPTLASYTFTPSSLSVIVGTSNSLNNNFTAAGASSPWSQIDSRHYYIFPNSTIDVEATQFYTVETDSRAAGAPQDCRAAKPVDSRASKLTNCRTAPPFED
jgi:hypothetical protein